MKRLLKSMVFILGFSVAQAGTQQISLEDILFLTERGVSDKTILVFLETRKIGFIPDAEDIDKLLSAVVSEEVIRYLLRQTATNSTPSTPSAPSAPSYNYLTRTRVALYPPFYYTPYYSGTSAFFGYSSYPLAWYGNHYGGEHYSSLQHGAAHYPGYNNHGTLSHTVRHGGGHASRSGQGHNVTVGIRHGGSRHTVAYGGRHSVGHSRRSRAHRGGGGHSRSRHGGGHGGGH